MKLMLNLNDLILNLKKGKKKSIKTEILVLEKVISLTDEVFFKFLIVF